MREQKMMGVVVLLGGGGDWGGGGHMAFLKIIHVCNLLYNYHFVLIKYLNHIGCNFFLMKCVQ